MFEDVLQLPVQGVIRFVIEPAFAARQFYTFLYTPDVVLAALVIRGVGLWAVMPLEAGCTDQPELVERLYPSVSRGVPNFCRLARSRYEVAGCCPESINNWPGLRAWTVEAVECVAPVLDGEGYWHALYDREGMVSALWCNPSAEDGFPVQAGLVAAYARLSATAQLTPRSVQVAFGIEDQPEPLALEPEEPAEAEDDGPRDRPSKKRVKPWQRRRSQRKSNKPL
jgi:hypothetical protein